MTPQARAQAAIELLDEIVSAARGGGAAADTLIARYFKTRRYAGSKDRRAVRDLVYAAIRRAGEIPANGRAAMIGLAQQQADIAELFDGSPHGPSRIGDGENGASAGVAPAWLAKRLARTVAADEMPALLERAPLDIRVNRLKTDRDTLASSFPGATPTPHAADGLRLPEGTQVEAGPAWLEGQLEVQDEGSQLVAQGSGAKPGMTVVDLCAGAGGKTLALAAMMANRGRLIACDSDRGRLSRLAPRAMRAGVSITEERLLNPGAEVAALDDLSGAADIVLVDAPCSGTGTWRRNPETRWRLTPARLEQLTALQARLLDVAEVLVRPGGTLVYVVCSLLDEEGEAQAKGFMARHAGWISEPVGVPVGRRLDAGLMLTPAHDGTDGFFIATLKRPC